MFILIDRKFYKLSSFVRSSTSRWAMCHLNFEKPKRTAGQANVGFFAKKGISSCYLGKWNNSKNQVRRSQLLMSAALVETHLPHRTWLPVSNKLSFILQDSIIAF